MNNDLISREALMEDLFLKFGNQLPNGLLEEIDKAPTVETKTTYDVNRAYDRGYITAMNAYARPKGDLISRQDAIDALEEQLDYLQMLNKNENPTAEGKWYGVNWARNTIADLPYKQNERPKGEWIEKVYTTKVGYGYLTSHDIVCSVCGEDNDDIEGTPQMTKFCPNCGADMRGEEK